MTHDGDDNLQNKCRDMFCKHCTSQHETTQPMSQGQQQQTNLSTDNTRTQQTEIIEFIGIDTLNPHDNATNSTTKHCENERS